MTAAARPGGGRQVIDAVLADLPRNRGVVVDSPPGCRQVDAGGAGRRRAGRDRRAADDRRADQRAGRRPGRPARARRHPDAADRPAVGGRLRHARPRARGTANVRVAAQGRRTSATRRDHRSTAAKWAWIGDQAPGRGRSSTRRTRCARTRCCASPRRFERALFVGDPGQLDPFSTVEATAGRACAGTRCRARSRCCCAHNPDLPVHRLPVSWRLPASAAPVVAEAFYPFTGFRAGTGRGDRALELHRRAVRRTRSTGRWSEAAATGWALLRAAGPAHRAHRRRGRARPCAALAAAAAAARARSRTPSSGGARRSTADRIAIGAAHRDQVAAIRARSARAARRSPSTPPTACRAGSTT